MTRAPASAGPTACARACPRESGGTPWLKTTLIQCAWAAARKNGGYLQAQFHRLRSRHGAKKAIGALAASILTAAYHMLKDGTLYHDLGPDHFDRRAKTVPRHSPPKARLCRPDNPPRGVTRDLFLSR